MSSATTMILIAAAGAGAYYAFARPINEVKAPEWIEPKHEKSPHVTIFVKPDDAPSPTIYTDKNRVILNPLVIKPKSRMDRYVKKRGFNPGW